jgi:hypothetical protein
MIAVFWVVVASSLEEVYRRFRGACYLHQQGDECLLIEVASISEMEVNFYQTTRRNNPEDNRLHIHRRENLKSHKKFQALYGTRMFFTVY